MTRSCVVCHDYSFSIRKSPRIIKTVLTKHLLGSAKCDLQSAPKSQMIHHQTQFKAINDDNKKVLKNEPKISKNGSERIDHAT